MRIRKAAKIVFRYILMFAVCDLCSERDCFALAVSGFVRVQRPAGSRVALMSLLVVITCRARGRRIGIIHLWKFVRRGYAHAYA